MFPTSPRLSIYVFHQGKYRKFRTLGIRWSIVSSQPVSTKLDSIRLSNTSMRLYDGRMALLYQQLFPIGLNLFASVHAHRLFIDAARRRRNRPAESEQVDIFATIFVEDVDARKLYAGQQSEHTVSLLATTGGTQDPTPSKVDAARG